MVWNTVKVKDKQIFAQNHKRLVATASTEQQYTTCLSHFLKLGQIAFSLQWNHTRVGLEPDQDHITQEIQSRVQLQYSDLPTRTIPRAETHPGWFTPTKHCVCERTFSRSEWKPAVFNPSLWFVLAAKQWIKTSSLQEVASVHLQVSHSAAWLQCEHDSTLIRPDCRKWSRCVMGCRWVRCVPEDRVGVLQKYDVFWMSGLKNP